MIRGGGAPGFRKRLLLPRSPDQSGSSGAVQLGWWASGYGNKTSAPQFGPMVWP